MDRYVIGIDTGGTFTDGVLLDYYSRRVIKSAKALTTRHDLKEGVIDVIDRLDVPEGRKVKLVGISSTLATNSIAEGKGRKVGLLLIGYDRDLMEEYGLSDKLSVETIGHFAGGHDSQGREKTPLDIKGIREWIDTHKENVDAFAISSYFSPLNTAHEELAFEAVTDLCNTSVVMGHQLSTKLDSIKRAATAALNASLVSVMQEFIEAVRFSLDKHSITAPLMIVRGDGSLMPYTEAVQKPVDTIMSGPAASAIGGRFLSKHQNALVIDIGSTTTDMALVDSGQVVVSGSGARVGATETAVEAARIRTLCMGCDSRIHINKDGAISVGPERVVALSCLANQYPEVGKQVLSLRNQRPNTWQRYDLEYWFHYKSMASEEFEQLLPIQQQALKTLEQGPTSTNVLMKNAGVYHPNQLKLDELLLGGYIGVSALTPSDLLHAGGNLDIWDEDVAIQAVRCTCRIFEKQRKDFIETTLELMVSTILEEVIVFLACQYMPDEKMPTKIDGKWGRWLLTEMITGESPFLSVNIDSRYPLIGTGAPAIFFIRHVAELLSCPFVCPKHHEVANAVGAVAGSIAEIREARVFEQFIDGKHLHIVQIEETQHHFDDEDLARECAEKESMKRARTAVLDAGASDPHVDISISREGAIFRVIARAAGNPKLSENED